MYLDLLRSLGIQSSLSLSVTVGTELHSVMEFYSLQPKQQLGWEQLQLIRAAQCILARWLAQQERQILEQQLQQLQQLSEHAKVTLAERLKNCPYTFLSLLLTSLPDLCEVR